MMVPAPPPMGVAPPGEALGALVEGAVSAAVGNAAGAVPAGAGVSEGAAELGAGATVEDGRSPGVAVQMALRGATPMVQARLARRRLSAAQSRPNPRPLPLREGVPLDREGWSIRSAWLNLSLPSSLKGRGAGGVRSALCSSLIPHRMAR